MDVLTPADWIGLSLWAIAWLAYSLFAGRAERVRPSIMGAIAQARHAWMAQAYRRDNKITDVAVMGNLIHSATFFSSTSLLLVGSAFALLGAIERSPQQVLDVMRSLPFGAGASSPQAMEFKALLVALVFVYAFFRFTWALRQFNLVTILIGTFPAQKEDNVPDDPRVVQAARLNELAGVSFTQGLRAYYFSVPLLAWLLGPAMLVGASAAIVVAIYVMDFRSATVRALIATGAPRRSGFDDRPDDRPDSGTPR